MLKALRRRHLEKVADFAADDWAPVPVSASAAPKSWADWLAEEPPPMPSRAADRPAAQRPTPPLGIVLIGHTDQAPAPARPAAARAVATRAAASPSGPDYERHLTPEERAIIDAQRAKPRARTSTAPGFAKATATPRPGRRRPRTEELIREFGEHLTPEELAILERQLG